MVSKSDANSASSSVSCLFSSSHGLLAYCRERKGQQPSCREARAGTHPILRECHFQESLQDVCECSHISHPEPQKEIYIPTLVHVYEVGRGGLPKSERGCRRGTP